MVTPAEVTPVIVTRGDCDLGQILEPLLAAGLADPVIWDNAKASHDLSVYGRYEALGLIDTDVALVQDDDCVLPAESIEALLAAYKPGKLVANMPERFRAHYSDSCLVGFGAIFDWDLPEQAFAYYTRIHRVPMYPDPGLFMRECDTVFTCLTEQVWVDVPVQILPRAYDESKLYRQKDHHRARAEMLAYARQARDS